MHHIILQSTTVVQWPLLSSIVVNYPTGLTVLQAYRNTYCLVYPSTSDRELRSPWIGLRARKKKCVLPYFRPGYLRDDFLQTWLHVWSRNSFTSRIYELGKKTPLCHRCPFNHLWYLFSFRCCTTTVLPTPKCSGFTCVASPTKPEKKTLNIFR